MRCGRYLGAATAYCRGRPCRLNFASLHLGSPCSLTVFLSATAAPRAQTPLRRHVQALLASPPPHVSAANTSAPAPASAVACHGGIQPPPPTKVLQNEYSTWVTQDNHARAYTALTGSLGKQIAAILKIGPAG